VETVFALFNSDIARRWPQEEFCLQPHSIEGAEDRPAATAASFKDFMLSMNGARQFHKLLMVSH
jgi:hypothetical protein